MPSLEQLLIAPHVHCHCAAGSKKRIIQFVAQTLSSPTLSEDTLFDALMERERLGSTGLGDGVAIPHCRMECDEMQVALVSTTSPIDYEAIDGIDVDLFFVLIVPTNEQHAHLEALALLSEIFVDQANRQALRACAADDELHALMLRLLQKNTPKSKFA